MAQEENIQNAHGRIGFVKKGRKAALGAILLSSTLAVGGLPDGISYDMTNLPQDVCSRASSAPIMLRYSPSWVAIQKEMIDRALALPPDPERSAAWRKERSYSSRRPSLSNSSAKEKPYTYE